MGIKWPRLGNGRVCYVMFREHLMNLNLRSELSGRVLKRGGRPLPDRRQWIIRPDDLLVLDFSFENLQIQPGAEGDPAQLVKDDGHDSHKIGSGGKLVKCD